MSNQWLVYALLVVIFWGVYAVLLHEGSSSIGDPSPAIGRYKAFLFVGLAYFLVAIIGPVMLIKTAGAGWGMAPRGVGFSIAAGFAGALGAFGLLLALGAPGGTPPNVMAVVFGGAPVVNALVAIAWHPPAGGWKVVSPMFWLGIGVTVLGTFLVVTNRPKPPAPKPAKAAPTVIRSAGLRVIGAGYADVTQKSYDVS